MKTFITLQSRIIIVDKDKDQNRANLVWKLEDIAPKIFNTKWRMKLKIYINIGRKKR